MNLRNPIRTQGFNRMPWFFKIPVVLVSLVAVLYFAGWAAVRSAVFLNGIRLERAQVEYRPANKAAGEKMLHALRHTAAVARAGASYAQFKVAVDSSASQYRDRFLGHFIPITYSDHDFYSYADRASFNFQMVERRWVEIDSQRNMSDPMVSVTVRPFLDEAMQNLMLAEKEFKAYGD